MIPTKTHSNPNTNRNQYSEADAAAQLGVSVEELRSLVKSTIGDADPEMKGITGGFFQPSDLIMLRMLLLGRQNSGAPIL